MGEVAVCFCQDPSSLGLVGQRLSVIAHKAEEKLRDEVEECHEQCGRQPEHSLEHPENNEDRDSTRRLPLPRAFLEFLAKSGIDAGIYTAAQSLPRYVRIKPGFEAEVPAIEADLGIKLSPLSWLRGFFSLPREAQIAGSRAYQLGKMYGMDAASGAAVQALGVQPGDHVLDLCAAPGAKFCMIADYLGRCGTLTGVDIAHHRLAACRTMLLKYGLGQHCRLFVADGTKFSLLPSRETALKQEHIPRHAENGPCCESNDIHIKDLHTSKFNFVNTGSGSLFGEWRSRMTRKEKCRARRARMKDINVGCLSDEEPELLFYGNDSGVVGLKREELFGMISKDGRRASQFGYDKVLVDVECTHDGSLRHICKYEQWGWDTLERRVLDHDRMVSLSCLQLQLLINGFNLLKDGGTLLYSTCSFTTAQNEEVIEKFLSSHSNAELIEIKDAKANEWPCTRGLLVHTLRFDPMTSRTSGLFMAKVMKMHANQ